MAFLRLFEKVFAVGVGGAAPRESEPCSAITRVLISQAEIKPRLKAKNAGAFSSESRARSRCYCSLRLGLGHGDWVY
jgi:hypothetical protein